MKRLHAVWRSCPPRQRCDRLAIIQDQARLSEVRREQLVQLGLLALDDVQALSTREEDLGGDPLAASERYRYLVDAVTRGLGQVITDLANGVEQATKDQVTGHD